MSFSVQILDNRSFIYILKKITFMSSFFQHERKDLSLQRMLLLKDSVVKVLNFVKTLLFIL
jgi:hypothetical protein